MDFPHTLSTFDETIPSMYNQVRLYIEGITMGAPKRILTLTFREQRLVIQGLLEGRNELVQENTCSDIFDDLIIKLYENK